MTNANALPIQARLRGSVAAAAQAYTDAWFNNPGTARPAHCIPAKETDTDLVLAQGIKEAADRIDALEKALRRLVTAEEDGCLCSEMEMATAIDEARAALGEGE